MTREEFNHIYEAHKPRLEMELEDLKQLLDKGIQSVEADQIQRGMPPGMFRIRLKEGRVKDSESLYSKIAGDSDLSFENAFKPNHVRDLIGARLVCYNISDVINVVESLRKGKWGHLHYVEPDKGEKRWLEQPQSPSGYRGWHVDVRWQRKSGKGSDFSHAELQVRTLLQDAWATFMHDDVYKQNANLLLPDELFAQFSDMSNVLYALDQMAQRIRHGIESSRVVASSRIKAFEAISEAMFAMLVYSKMQWSIPDYESVQREDKYIVDGEDGEFQFEIDAKCKRAQDFSFPIAGDTPRDEMKSLVVNRYEKSQPKRLQDSQFEVVRPDNHSNVVVIRDKRRASIHHYSIFCRWGGVFSRGREYVWCPWAATYRGAMRHYKLSLGFKTAPRVFPRLYRVGEFSTLKDITSSADKGTGSPGTQRTDGSLVWFDFDIPEANDDYLCLLADNMVDATHVRDYVFGKRVMMGVSLGSRKFSRRFIEALTALLNGSSIVRLEIVIFEKCEAINYEVFRAMTPPDAVTRAEVRWKEVHRSLAAASQGATFPVAIVNEEEVCSRFNNRFEEVHAALATAYVDDAKFRGDVQRQVKVNLGKKLDALHCQLPEAIDLVSRYVLRELTVFECYFRAKYAEVELYPGESLFVKQRLWNGEYDSLKAFEFHPSQPTFVNLSLVRGLME